MSLKDEFFTKGKVEDCPIYDLHGHMGPVYGIHLPLADTARMVKTMDRVGVKMLVFCHHGALFTPNIGNLANIEAVRMFPDKLRAYCGLNGNYPEICRKDIETFDDYRDVYLGFKILADYHLISITDSIYQPAWELANERQLMMLLHTWGGSPFDGAEQVREVAEKYPNAAIILGHSLHGDWDGAISIANEFPNTYLELTAVLDDRGILERFLDKVSSEKIVFGTDFPWFDHHYYIGAVLGTGATDEDCRNIFYRNAERVISKVALSNTDN